MVGHHSVTGGAPVSFIVPPRERSLFVELPTPTSEQLYPLRRACIPYPGCMHYTIAYEVRPGGLIGDPIQGWPGECFECPTHIWWDDEVPWCWFTTQALTTTGTGNSFTVPGTWNNANNTCQAIGSGGNGFTASFAAAGGGGGGAYATTSNVSLSGTASYNIGAGGSTTATQFVNSSTLVADYGRTPSSTTGGVAGSASNCIPTTGAFSGGTGGAGATDSGGGGAGSAGPTGAGKNGGSGDVSLDAAGGGGGSNGGSSTAGTNASSSDVGGAGGAGTGGTGGGAGGSNGNGGTATANTGAGGGGAGGNGKSGGAGATSQVWASTYGPGGGGGGSAGTSGTGGAGGVYGGGGGGAVTVGSGGQGIIFLTWTPIAAAYPYSRQRIHLRL